MIYIVTEKKQWEYDIHSLVKAFYPEKQVKVMQPPFMEAPADLETDEGSQPISIIVLDIGEKAENKTEEIKKETERDFGENPVGFPFLCILPDGTKKQTVLYGESPVDLKKSFKRAFYQILSAYTHKELPWGNLTGIRPTKIAMGMLEEGVAKEEVRAYFEKEHFVSAQKSHLAVEIAEREMNVLSALDQKDGYSLYIGIPFCPTTCLYCSFTSYPLGAYQEQVDAYLRCIEKELRLTKELMGDKAPDTVYIGGGTPTTLKAEQLDSLLSMIEKNLDLSALKEFTVEAGRADSITREKLQALFAHAVSRISINPQTMRDETLRRIGRRHDSDQVRRAFALAREMGFDNINMDIILGLPGENEEDVAYTLREIESLKPDNLTIHSLAIKRASKLRQYVEENGLSMISNTDETMRIAAEGACRMEMKPYYLYRQKNMSGNFENVGYAREGKYGIYNILIMEEVQTIVALGAGSISKRVFPDGRIERCDNVKEVAQYIERIDEMMERKRVLLGDEYRHD